MPVRARADMHDSARVTHTPSVIETLAGGLVALIMQELHFPSRCCGTKLPHEWRNMPTARLGTHRSGSELRRVAQLLLPTHGSVCI